MTNDMQDFSMQSPAAAPADVAMTRPLYWSLRRELWENRSIYVAPLVVVGVVMFGFFVRTLMMPSRIAKLLALDAAKQREAIAMPYTAIAGMVMVTAFLIAAYYCLDALHGERRDRSILFWKSLPVSDATTVLSKALIPLAVLPIYAAAVIVVAQSIMLTFNTLIMLGNERGLRLLFAHVTFFQSTVAMLYGIAAITLWHAPLYAWLLMVSAWARRAAFLWSVLPILAIGALEKMAFNTTHFMHLMGFRMTGWFLRAFALPPKGSTTAVDPFATLTPGRFLATPGLWIGLVVAALFLGAAVRLRRNREPI